MNNVIKVLLFVLVLFTPVVIKAATISGNHVLSNGKTVDLGGEEWLSLDMIPSGTYNEVALLLQPGGELYGWEFATRTQTENLLDSLWGGIGDGWSVSNFPGAEWFMNNFGWTTSSGSGTDILYYSRFWFAKPGDCGVVTGVCVGQVGLQFHSTLDPGRGFFHDALGLSDGGTEGNINNSEPPDRSVNSALLVRSVVPIPAAVWLFSSGLIGLIGIARRKKA